MPIELPPGLDPFVEQEFATGRYATREEVVVQALCWLRDERQEAVSGIKQGLDDVPPVERSRSQRHSPISGRNSESGKRNDISVIVTQKAKDDLRHYFAVAAEHAPQTAARWLNRFEGTLQTLSTNPTRCPLAPENDLVDQPVYQFFYGKRIGLVGSWPVVVPLGYTQGKPGSE